MIEIPEAVNLSRQIAEICAGKAIQRVTVGHTPHKFAWFYGNPASYQDLLSQKTISGAAPAGGMVRAEAGNTVILFAEGLTLRYHAATADRPSKHQFLLEFADGSALSAATQMYGGMGVFREGDLDNPYYRMARAKPSPLSAEFDRAWFDGLGAPEGMAKLSLKAFLATEQRIPGLGNGVLQDILFAAALHPKRKWGSLDEADKKRLFMALREVLAAMAQAGGRDTERGLQGEAGAYRTILSSARAGKPCPLCGTLIIKQPYLGGSIYFCPSCQPE